MGSTSFRSLQDSEIQQLEQNGCRSADWSKVHVADPLNVDRIRNVEFDGDVQIDVLDGTVEVEGGVQRPSGIQNASLINCSIGKGSRVVEVKGQIAGYNIGDGAVVEGIGSAAVVGDSTFGAGVEVAVVNEGGGREITLFANMNSQITWLQAMMRRRPKFISALNKLIQSEVDKEKSNRGTIGNGAVVRFVSEIRNVNIGPAARVVGADVLENGTILSDKSAPAVVGGSVTAKNFIFAEGSSVKDGVVFTDGYVGQASKLARQFSAENSVFFANSEGFHGEAVSLFAGPYTVTHHKSTLLIAGMYSFYNAGSGTNQSNHMYKLGPVHQGVLERGVKTGSFSYMMWPCRVGPFSVVIGKHKNTFDLENLPFSYIEPDDTGKTYVVPGLNLYTVGTLRDGAKWPARDNRKGTVKRDLIQFDVFNPQTLIRLLNGEEQLSTLAAETDKKVEDVRFNGARIKRILLKSGARYYRNGIDMKLYGELFARAEAAVSGGVADIQKALQISSGAASGEQWTDVGGLLMAKDRLSALVDDVESGKLDSVEAVLSRLNDINEQYGEDSWSTSAKAYQKRFRKQPSELNSEELAEAADNYLKIRGKFIRMVLSDAEKEFDETSRLGFGLDGGVEERDADFTAVRGTIEDNKFIQSMNKELQDLEKRVNAFKSKIS